MFAKVKSLQSPRRPRRIVAEPRSAEFESHSGSWLGGQVSGDPAEVACPLGGPRKHLRDDAPCRRWGCPTCSAIPDPRADLGGQGGLWLGGIHLKVGVEQEKMFRLVMMEVGADGTKERSSWTRASRKSHGGGPASLLSCQGEADAVAALAPL